MAIQKSQVVKPNLPVEEVLIEEIGPAPVRVHGLLLKAVRNLSQEAEAIGSSWEILLFHKSILDNAGEPIYTPDEWEIFQVAYKGAWEKINEVIVRVNGWNKEETEKK